MGYLTGIKVGKQPSPAFGAVVGFGQGLYRGIQDQREHQAQQARLGLAQQEMMLRQRALQHGLDRDEDVKDFSRSIGEFQAWRSGTDDEAQGQGPTRPGDAALPSRTKWDEVSTRLQDIASKISDPKTAAAFLSVAQGEMQLKELSEQKERIASSISDRIVNNSYSRRIYGGAEDPSGSEAAQALVEQVQNADLSDPQAAAQLLDYVEKKDLELRQHTVAHNIRMEQRESMLAQVEQQIMQREGAGVPMNEAKALTAAYKGGLMEDEQFQKYLPDAMAGTLQAKMMAAQKDAQIQQLQMELLQMKVQQERRGMLPGGDSGLSRSKAPAPVEDPFGGMNRSRPKNGADQSDRIPPRAKMLQDELDSLRRANGERAPSKRQSEADLRKQANENVDAILGGEAAAPAQDKGAAFAARIAAGEFGDADGFDEEKARKAMEEAGVTEEEVMAASGGK